MTKVRKNQNEKAVEQAARETAVTTTGGDFGLTVVDLSIDGFPDMENAFTAPIDLMADYWTPEKIGETKRLLFDRIGNRTVLDQKSEAQIELECAFFYEKVEGQINSVSNGSKRLVGAMQSLRIARGTILEIKYLGKKKNSTNSNMSDSWSIKPLILRMS